MTAGGNKRNVVAGFLTFEIGERDGGVETTAKNAGRGAVVAHTTAEDNEVIFV